MAYKIQLRRDTKVNWTTNNPILNDGEIGLEKDSIPYKIKIGDGIKTWVDLPYYESGNASSINTDILKFKESFGVIVKNEIGNDVGGNTFVKLLSSTGDIFKINTIDKNTGYKGELLGYLRNPIKNGEEGFVELIGMITTGVTTASIGEDCYLGFNSMDSLDSSMSINKKENLYSSFGKCGTFGVKNMLGESTVSFNCFELQSNYLVNNQNKKEFEYYNTNVPIIMDKDVSHVVYKSNVVDSGSGQILEQNLPSIKQVSNGYIVNILNTSSDYTNKIRIKAQTGESINGEDHVDINGRNSRLILIATNNKWDVFLSHDSMKDDYDFQLTQQNFDDINRLKTNMNTIQNEKVYVYRGQKMPVIPSDQRKAYYINIYGITSSQNFELPTNVRDGVVLMINNEDITNNIMVRVKKDSGEVINSIATGINVPAENILFLIKNGTNWEVGFSGFIPSSLQNLLSSIKSKLGGTLNNIDEIKAQLKDQLHTFREIQDHFKDQLHTMDEIDVEMDNRGYTKSDIGRILFGESNNSGYMPSSDDNVWVIGTMESNQEAVYPIVVGSKYIYIAIPKTIDELVNEITIAGTPIQFTKTDWMYKNYSYTLYRSNNSFDMSSVVKVSIHYKVELPDIDIGVGYDILSATDTNTLQFNSSFIDEPDGMPKAKIITPYINVIDLEQVVDDENPSSTVNIYEDKVNKMSFTPPLRIKQGDNNKSSIVDINPSEYEKRHIPSYLAYSVGKKRMGNGVQILSYEDIAYETKYDNISYDMKTKTYTLKEDLESAKLNKGEGTDYFIEFRISSHSYCIEEGKVKIAIVDANNIDSNLHDFSGTEMVASREYKFGYWVGDFQIGGVFRVKGELKFKLKMESSVGDIEIQDRVGGASGILIQMLNEEEQTSPSMNSWNLDTGTVSCIGKYNMDKHFIDTNMSILADVMKSANKGSTTVPSSTYFPLTTGEFFHTSNQAEVINKEDLLNIQGTPFFDVGYGLDSERTKLLRNQEIRIWCDCRIHYDPSGLNNDSQNAWFIIAKWTGNENANPTDPITGIQSDGTLTYAQGMEEIWKIELIMNTSYQEGKSDFFLNPNNIITVPANATNLLAFIVPKHTVPIDIDVKNIRIDAMQPSTQYAVQNRVMDGANGFFSHTITDTVVGDGNIIPITKQEVDLYKSLPSDVTSHSLLTNTAPITIIGSPDNTKMEGIQFLQTGEVMVSVCFNAVRGDLENTPKRLKFYIEISDQTTQSNRAIHSSVRYFTIVSNKYPTNCELTIPIKVIKGDRIRFLLSTPNKDNDVWLKYDNGGYDEEGILFQTSLTYINSNKMYQGDVFTYTNQ